MVAPAILMAVLERAEGAEITLPEAARHARLPRTEAAAGQAYLPPRITGPGLGVDHHRPAQRVQAIDSAAVEQGDAADRRLGQQVERDSVAKELVDRRPVERPEQSR